MLETLQQHRSLPQYQAKEGNRTAPAQVSKGQNQLCRLLQAGHQFATTSETFW